MPLLCLALLVLAPAAGASVRVNGPAKPVHPGQALTARVTLRGPVVAGRIALLLSKDARRDRRDATLGAAQRIGRIARGRTVRRTLRGRVPKAAKPGRYRLLACITPRRGRGACGVATGRLVVTAAGSAPGGSTTPGAPSLGTPIDTNPTTVLGGPLAVTPQLQADRAATSTIGPAGGAIAVTAADGTTITLTLPADALLGPVDITLTPLAAVGGLPFSGGLAGGVQMAPNGLQLLKPGRLTVEPPAGVPADRRTPFGYRGDGQDFHLLPETADGIEVDHFSGAGLANGTAAERDAQRARVPSDPQAAAEQELFFGADAAPLQALWTVVQARLLAADADHTLAVDAVTAGVQLEQMMQAHAGNPLVVPLLTQLHTLVQQVLLSASEASYRGCVDHADLDEVGRLMALEMLAQRFGYGVPDAQTRVAGCARFELDADVSFTYDDTWGFPGAVTRHVVTNLLIQPEVVGSQLLVHAEKTPDQATLSYDHTQDECRVWAAGPSQVTKDFIVDDLSLTVIPGVPQAGELRLWVEHSESLEQFQQAPATENNTCDADTFTMPLHTDAVRGAYFADFEQGHGVLLRGWELAGSPLVATKHVDRNLDIDGTTYQEHSTYTVRHVPLPGA